MATQAILDNHLYQTYEKKVSILSTGHRQMKVIEDGYKKENNKEKKKKKQEVEVET